MVVRDVMTPYGAFIVLWIVLTTFNFGFGTSELNPLQRALTCPSNPVLPQASASASLPRCLYMSNTHFGYVTAAFTVGGFIGSLGLSPLKNVVQSLQRSKRALLLSSTINILGGVVQACSTSWPMLSLGRLFMGIGSGIALVVVPGYLNDIAPPSVQGSIGVLNQLSIVIGILSAQALGVSNLGDAPTSSNSYGPWRWVPVVASLISVVHVLLSPLAIDSPSELANAAEVRSKLWKTSPTNGNVESESLLTPEEPDADTNSEQSTSRRSSAAVHPRNVSVGYLISLAFLPTRAAHGNNDCGDEMRVQEVAQLRRGTRMIIFTQIAQQLSGVNAVLYFSTGILSEALNKDQGRPDGDRLARLIGLGITVVNFIMTFPPIPLIDEGRLGRKRLLQISSGVMAVSAAVLGVSLVHSYTTLASVSTFTFTAGFSAGLGPIPFLILPELVPRYAVASASSLGIGCNWLANIALASVFLPLKDILGGNVFFVFVAIDTIIFVVISRFYKYAPPTSLEAH